MTMWDLHKLERYERMEQRKADKKRIEQAREDENALLRRMTAVTPVYNPLLDIPKHMPRWRSILNRIRKLPRLPLTAFKLISPLPGPAPQPVTVEQEAQWDLERERRYDDAVFERMYLSGELTAEDYTLLIFQPRN